MTDINGNMVMPVAPYYGGNGNDGMFGGNGSWMWFLLIWMAMFGWGNGGYGFGGGQGGGRIGSEVQNGFDHQAVMTGINGILPAVQNGFAQAEISANSRQMADMNQNFQLQSALQNCCCENRAATADLKYTMATEAEMYKCLMMALEKQMRIEQIESEMGYEDGMMDGMSGRRGRNPSTGRYMSMDGGNSYADGYSQGYSEGMRQSGHWPPMPYPDRYRY